jgi:hypothetical protein
VHRIVGTMTLGRLYTDFTLKNLPPVFEPVIWCQTFQFDVHFNLGLMDRRGQRKNTVRADAEFFAPDRPSVLANHKWPHVVEQWNFLQPSCSGHWSCQVASQCQAFDSTCTVCQLSTPSTRVVLYRESKYSS